jgi:hypothetical protein
MLRQSSPTPDKQTATQAHTQGMLSGDVRGMAAMQIFQTRAMEILRRQGWETRRHTTNLDVGRETKECGRVDVGQRLDDGRELLL